jgi:LmbE family N-acetylglucosaminyl deacetylase
MRWIYISPHLDDAVLSAGGLIYEQSNSGIPVEIWTMMCGIPQEEELSIFAQVVQHQWGASSAAEANNLRRQEDMMAASIVGAKAFHFDFLDCIYRRSRDGGWLYADIFQPPHEEDADLPRRMADTMIPRLARGDTLVCPLGLGAHVDHILVRRAVELTGYPVLFVADVPYVFRNPELLGPSTARMQETVHAVTETGLKSWVEAVEAYGTQLSSLFVSHEDVQESLRRYCQERGGITLYSPE